MICDIMNAEWPCKETESSFMLGVKRTITVQPNGIRNVTISMEAYIEAMYETFKEYCPTKSQTTPCEHNMMLSLSVEVPEYETNRVLKRGYQRAVGMLLWVSRGVAHVSLYGMQQLCKLKSKPSELAWEAVIMMKLIAWLI
jgi:hypothetical protein